ncbi:MAG: amidohydrolase [Congregibacter sp.]
MHAGWALLEIKGRLELQRDTHLLVRDGLIEAISDRRFRGVSRYLDVSRDLVLPGFISGHTHCCSATPTRGIIEGPRSYRRPLELVEALSDEELDALTAFNLAELLRSGCTTQLEMSLSLRQAESYVRVARRWGVRGYPGAMIPDMSRLFPIWFRDTDQVLRDSEEDTLTEIAANLAFGRKHLGNGDGLIRPMMSPHACDTHTHKTMRAIVAAAQELGTGLHIHLSQGARETQTVKRMWGKTPTQALRDFGFLQSGPVFGAHMMGLDWETDAPILAEHGVVFAHCPSAGGAGGDTQPYPEALAAGIPSNIAIDTHSNDYLENLKLAVLYGQARHALARQWNPDGLPTRSPTIWDAVESATRVPAKGLRRDDLGVIKAGARADLISVDVSGLLVGAGSLPPEPLNNLLYANGRMVRTVMTDGALQVLDGQFIAGPVDAIVSDGAQVVSKIWSQLDDESWFTEIPRHGG